MEFKNLKNGVIEIFNELIKRGKVRSNRDFFAPIGVSDSVGSGILSSNSDRTLPKKKIQDLVNTWNVCETFLQNGQHPIFRSDGLNYNTLNDEENKALIPMYNAPAAAGGIEVYADTESGKVVGHISFPGITNPPLLLKTLLNAHSGEFLMCFLDHFRRKSHLSSQLFAVFAPPYLP